MIAPCTTRGGGGVENVLIENCRVHYGGVGVEVKVGTTRGGYVRPPETRWEGSGRRRPAFYGSRA